MLLQGQGGFPSVSTSISVHAAISSPGPWALLAEIDPRRPDPGAPPTGWRRGPLGGSICRGGAHHRTSLLDRGKPAGAPLAKGPRRAPPWGAENAGRAPFERGARSGCGRRSREGGTGSHGTELHAIQSSKSVGGCDWGVRIWKIFRIRKAAAARLLRPSPGRRGRPHRLGRVGSVRLTGCCLSPGRAERTGLAGGVVLAWLGGGPGDENALPDVGRFLWFYISQT